MSLTNSIENTKETNRMIYSRFSHELRNPLTIVVNELRNLSSRHPEISEYEEFNTIQNNLQYMQELLDGFSELQYAGMLSRHPTNICAYLQDIVKAVRPSMDYLNIRFSLETETDLPECRIDRIRMRQVFLNLLRNAQDALPSQGGRIIIRAVHAKGHLVRITVEDNGCGILPQDQERIFQPFVTSKETGSGLGLAIAREIVEAHQGRLTVESSPGKGTAFQILL